MKTLLLCGAVLSIGAGVSSAATLAFPGAEGFGALASGGRGGEVVYVTNLNDAGPGSFRDAVSKPNRTVLFQVGGVIRVKKQVEVEDNITIAGQTAPGGVGLLGGGISLSAHKNIVVRYMTFRGGIETPRGSKSLNIYNGQTIIVDHCSIGWGRWDNVGITAKGDAPTFDVTLQNCLIHEAIKDQQFGMIVDNVRRLSLVRNLWNNNRARNPKGKGDLQFINNVIYNWGTQGYGGGHSGAPWNQDLQGNYLIAGPDSNTAFFTFTNANDLVYSQGNFVDLDRDGTLNGRAWTTEDVTKPDPKSNEGAVASTQPFNQPGVPVTVLPAEQAVAEVVARAGNSLHRDAIDQRQIDQLKSFGKLGKNPQTEADVGGAPATQPANTNAPVDTDRDGIPDAWETAHGLSPTDPNDGKQLTASGYTNLETYLNSLVP
ncbi:MAG: hypothetical protein QM754_00760 [Tepidisphaeraceae bacterium]